MNRMESLSFALLILGAMFIALGVYQLNAYSTSQEQTKATLELFASNPAFAGATEDAAGQATKLADRIAQTTLNLALYDIAAGIIALIVALMIAPDKK